MLIVKLPEPDARCFVACRVDAALVQATKGSTNTFPKHWEINTYVLVRMNTNVLTYTNQLICQDFTCNTFNGV